jgi:predicted transcriptional regulator
MATNASSSDMAFELNDTDQDVIAHLNQRGNDVPANIGERLGQSRQYIHKRLQLLEAAGHVENIGRGVYALRNDPREEGEA